MPIPKKRRIKKEVIIPDWKKVTSEHFNQVPLASLTPKDIIGIGYTESKKTLEIYTSKGEWLLYRQVEKSIADRYYGTIGCDTWEEVERNKIAAEYEDVPEKPNFELEMKTKQGDPSQRFAHLIKK